MNSVFSTPLMLIRTRTPLLVEIIPQSRFPAKICASQPVIFPRSPLQPDSTATLNVDWHFDIPGGDNFRMQHANR